MLPSLKEIEYGPFSFVICPAALILTIMLFLVPVKIGLFVLSEES